MVSCPELSFSAFVTVSFGSCVLRYLPMKNVAPWKWGWQTAPVLPRVLLGKHLFSPRRDRCEVLLYTEAETNCQDETPKDKETCKWLSVSRGNLIIADFRLSGLQKLFP